MDFTRAGFMGAWRIRTPVASKNALATAAGTTRQVASPAPVGGASGRLINTISISYGASLMSKMG